MSPVRSEVPTGRGIDGALLDLEYERIELIKFNLFDNNKTYQEYITGRRGVGGPALKTFQPVWRPCASRAHATQRRTRDSRATLPLRPRIAR